MSSIISARPFGLYHHLHKSNLQRLPFLLVKAMGYSSFIAVIVSMIVYWYKKQLAHQSRLESLKKEKQAITLAVHDECRLNPKKKLHITTTNHGLRRTSSSLKRTSSTMTNLANERHMFTPPPSPLSIPSTPTRTTSPSGAWSSRIMDGVISFALMNKLIRKKKMTISLKNTVLWNPSSDVNTPNHAFHEKTVLLLNKLAQVYDIYVIIHLNTDQERLQIQQLLTNANLLLDDRKIVYCGSEQGKVHVIQHIQPTIHVEGGCEQDNGIYIVEHLEVERIIWVLPFGQQQQDQKNIEFTDHILHTSIAKQVGFEA